MEKSNAHLKLIDWNEFSVLWENHEEFRSLAMNITHYLDNMKSGDAFSLSKYGGKKLSWIVKIICMYMYSDAKHLEYEFNDTYTIVRRVREISKLS